MSHNSTRFFASSLILLFALLAGCGGDGLGPSPDIPAGSSLQPDSATSTPTDTTLAAPIDSTMLGTGDSTSISGFATLTGATAPGIVFASFGLDNSLLGTVHTGSLRVPGPTNILSLLSGIRAKGARVIIKMSGSTISLVKNADGTFSFTKWKALVDRFKAINFTSYLTDGTILGVFLIDEPYTLSKWGGKGISQATVEALAKYSKQLWPGLTTFVRAPPSWLAKSSITYTYLDGGWTQYATHQGDPLKWVTAEVAAAKSKGLGLMVGLNVLDGGNGSSGIPGTVSGKYAMSASELRTYGTAMMSPTHACGFVMRMYNSTYYGRSDIKSAMADLSNKAKAHVKTSCRQ